MPRNPDRPVRCTLHGCDRPHEALGYCKPHYRRFRAYGDPLAAGRVGGVVRMPAELAASGLTYRQIRYWCTKGYLRAPVDPQSRSRQWTADEVRVALLIHKLTNAGLPLHLAAPAARASINEPTKTEGIDVVCLYGLAPGVALALNLEMA